MKYEQQLHEQWNYCIKKDGKKEGGITTKALLLVEIAKVISWLSNYRFLIICKRNLSFAPKWFAYVRLRTNSVHCACVCLFLRLHVATVFAISFNLLPIFNLYFSVFSLRHTHWERERYLFACLCGLYVLLQSIALLLAAFYLVLSIFCICSLAARYAFSTVCTRLSFCSNRSSSNYKTI